ncbi:MAG: hypothetical protein ACP5MZ_03955 [Candidatus Micrarchaeia archaeon]
MKAQTSIEFIMILAAVAGLSATFVYAYAHLGTQMDAVYGYLNRTQQNNNTTMQGDYGTRMEIYAYVPPIAYTGKISTIEVIAALPDNAGSMVIMPKSQYFDFSPDKVSVNASLSPYIAYFQAVPRFAGNASVEIVARAVESNGTVMYKSINESTLVYTSGTSTGSIDNSTHITATLSESNESVLYALSGKEEVSKLEETSHCTYLNFWYTPLSFQNQCGNAVWDFSIFSDGCYDAGSTGRTYCVYEDPTGAYTRNITGQSSYMYNLTLSLAHGNKTYIATVNSNRKEAPLLMENLTEGNVTIGGQVDGQAAQAPSLIEVMDYSMNQYPIGIRAYDTYEQYSSALDAKLGYYNGSGVESSEFSSIQQSISSYNIYLGRFLNTSEYKGCSVIGYKYSAYLSCPITAPLDFTNITVYLDNYTADKTLYVDGSTINLR